MNKVILGGTVSKVPKIYGDDKKRVMMNVRFAGVGKYQNYMFVKAFGYLAEALIDAGVDGWNGREVDVVGSLETENWAKNQSEKNWVITIWAESVKLADPPPADEGDDGAPF